MSSSSFARTPEPPYYAVIFSSTRTAGDNGYGQMVERMLERGGRAYGKPPA